MRITRIWMALALCVLGSFVVLAQEHAQPKPSDLQGVWRLRSLTFDGAPIKAAGYLIFFGNHYVFLTTRERPNLSAEVGRKKIEELTDAERTMSIEVFRNMSTTAGTYTIQEGKIAFLMEVTRLPHLTDQVQKRKSWLENGRLVQDFNGGGRRQVYVWELVK